MSLPQCPTPGLCLDLSARMEAAESADRRHDDSLARIGAAVDSLRADVHGMRVEAGLRNAAADDLKKWFMGIIFVGLLQFSATVWWASSLHTVVIGHTEELGRHRAKIEKLNERN